MSLTKTPECISVRRLTNTGVSNMGFQTPCGTSAAPCHSASLVGAEGRTAGSQFVLRVALEYCNT